MALKPAAYSSVATSHTNLELSHEALRSLLGQIEAELYHSESYQRAIASLQALLGEAAQGTQSLIQAVAREAIGLALKQFIGQYRTVPVATPGNPSTAQSILPEDTRENVAGAADIYPSLGFASTWAFNAPASAVTVQPTTLSESISDWPNSGVPALQASGAIGQPSGDRSDFGQPSASQLKTEQPTAEHSYESRKLKQPELTTQTLEQKRQERLLAIGQELREARQARFLSLQQLQRQTLVPISHLEALEIGNLARLPEDVYVRGFIRRLGDALGLDGAGMAASIPLPDPIKSVVPSWSPISTQPEVYLRTGHLYLGYAALVVGAVGGLSWFSGQATSGAVAEPNPTNASPAAVSPSNRYAQPISTQNLKSSRVGVPAWSSDVAPPEALAF